MGQILGPPEIATSLVISKPWRPYKAMFRSFDDSRYADVPSASTRSQHLSQQGRAQPLPLRRLLGAQDEQIPVRRTVGMPRLHALQPTQYRGGPQTKELD